MSQSEQQKMLILVPESISAEATDDLNAGPSTRLDSKAGDAVKHTYQLARALFVHTPHKEEQIDIDVAKNRWREGISTVQTLIEAGAERVIAGWRLDEISVGMAISATGKLAFIAEASMEASVHIVFKRIEDDDDEASA